jgi:predicted ATPase
LEVLESLPERDQCAQRELDLLVALGVPLVLIRGHAAPEVETTYARARELSEQVGDKPQHFHVLQGLRRFYLHRGELQMAHEVDEQFLALAQNLGDASHISRAHIVYGETLYRSGAFAQAREHCEQAIALYAPQQHRSHMFLYGNDTGAVSQTFQALVLWHLGYPDQALSISLEGLSRAQELSHPFTLVCALYFAAALRHFRGEGQAALKQVESLLGISTERRFALYLAWGTVLRGRLLAEQGEIEEGIAQMRQGLAAWQAMGAELMLPEIFSLLAEACGKAGKVEEGIALLTAALDLVDKNGDRCWEAEIYRLKGELLLKQDKGEVGVCDAETCFQRALAVARHQSAKSWKLRAAASLGRLWREQGRREEARQMLAEIYGWFTEGFDTLDLKEAKVLLDELSLTLNGH